MPRGPRASQILRQAIGAAFQQLIRSRPELTQSVIARELGVSRQTVHQYIRGKVAPSAETLARAVRRWSLTITVDGVKFDEETLDFKEHSEGPRPIQLSLARLFQGPVDIALPESGASIRLAANADGNIEIHVRLKMTA